LNVKLAPIGKLNPAAYNPRKDLQEGDPEFETLKDNILKYGFVQPIVVNVRTGNMVGGHQRLKVAKALNMKKVPTVEVDLDLVEEKKLNLSLNKVGGSWDEDALGKLLAELKGAGEDLDITGFDELEIEELTVAFADVDLNAEFEAFDGGGYEDPLEGEESEYEPTDDAEDLSEEKGIVVKYEIIFDDETQQAVWHEFLRKLKGDFDNDAFPTHASRIHAFLKREVFK
jgi:ParB-like nuclease domain